MSTPLSYRARKELFRNKPREYSWRKKNSHMGQYYELIASLSKDEYQVYEGLMHRFKRPSHMAAYCASRTYSKPITDLVSLRVQDKYEHMKVLMALRHRWTNVHERGIDEFNKNSDNFWVDMAKRIQKRNINKFGVHEDWDGPEGLLVLVEFLKKMYETQNGGCSLSNEKMQLLKLKSGKNYSMCSPDRKNSSKGYTPTNLWLVTFWANQMKLDTPKNEFVRRIHSIAAVHKLNKKLLIKEENYDTLERI